MTIMLNHLVGASAASAAPGFVEGSVSSNLQPRPEGRGVPAIIRADQAYYWSPLWREVEAEALADLLAGDFETYDSPADAVKGLHRID